MWKRSSFLFLLSIFVLGCCAPLTLEANKAAETLAPAPISLSKNTEIPPMRVNKSADFERRVEILEADLAQMRKEMNLIRPVLQDLIARRAAAAEQSQPVMEVKPQSKMAAQQQAPKPKARAPKKVEKTKPAPEKPVVPKTYQGPAKLADIRTGEHPGKTRVVLDVGSKTPFSYDLDNSEHILVIELPEAAAEKELHAALKNSPYVASYQSQSSGQGARVVVQLKKAAKILTVQEIKPTGGKGHRIFFDIGPAS